MNKLFLLITIIFVVFVGCKNPDHENSKFNIEDVKPIIIENGKNWSRALKAKDVSIIENQYDKDSHYLPDGDNAYRGNKSIKEYWIASFPFLNDIQLTMESLEGTKELLYETGHGIALVANEAGGSDTLKFKYVNVWKLNNDGKYRVVIDIYNDVKK